MKVFWTRAKPIVSGVLCVLLALYFSPLSLLVGYALATHDLAFWLAMLLKIVVRVEAVLVGVPIAFAVFCVGAVAAIEAYQEREPLAPKFYYALLFCMVYLASCLSFPGLGFAWPQRRAGLQKAAARARPLIGAIEQFQTEQKRAPHDLQELVPRYLPAIPPTGMTRFPRFGYSTRQQKGQHAKFQTYQLQISTSSGLLNWDTFNYWPEGDYPDQLNGNSVERVGAWAYVHE